MACRLAARLPAEPPTTARTPACTGPARRPPEADSAAGRPPQHTPRWTSGRPRLPRALLARRRRHPTRPLNSGQAGARAATSPGRRRRAGRPWRRPDSTPCCKAMGTGWRGSRLSRLRGPASAAGSSTSWCACIALPWPCLAAAGCLPMACPSHRQHPGPQGGGASPRSCSSSERPPAWCRSMGTQPQARCLPSSTRCSSSWTSRQPCSGRSRRNTGSR